MQPLNISRVFARLISKKIPFALWIALVTFSTTARADTITPEEHYVMHCQGCHRADGQGLPSVVPGFGAQLAQILQTAGGRDYLIRVPGVSMAPIDDAQLADVLNWVLGRYLKSDLPTTYPRFTAQEVASIRRPPLNRPLLERQRLLNTKAQP